MIGPLLVTGASGALGDAFVRIASRRGLTCHPTRRSELDLTDPASIARALHRQARGRS